MTKKIFVSRTKLGTDKSGSFKTIYIVQRLAEYSMCVSKLLAELKETFWRTFVDRGYY